MKTISKEFHIAVIRFFQPVACSAGLHLERLRDGIYEIAGATFVMRIRKGTGHRRDFLVTLTPKSSEIEDLDDLSQEIGLAVIAEYNGMQLQVRNSHESDFAEAATMAEKLLVPYLVNAKNDFRAIRNFVEDKIVKSGAKQKTYHFPPNVREEWL